MRVYVFVYVCSDSEFLSKVLEFLCNCVIIEMFRLETLYSNFQQTKCLMNINISFAGRNIVNW